MEFYNLRAAIIYSKGFFELQSLYSVIFEEFAVILYFSHYLGHIPSISVKTYRSPYAWNFMLRCLTLTVLKANDRIVENIQNFLFHCLKFHSHFQTLSTTSAGNYCNNLGNTTPVFKLFCYKNSHPINIILTPAFFYFFFYYHPYASPKALLMSPVIRNPS